MRRWALWMSGVVLSLSLMACTARPVPTAVSLAAAPTDKIKPAATPLILATPIVSASSTHALTATPVATHTSASPTGSSVPVETLALTATLTPFMPLAPTTAPLSTATPTDDLVLSRGDLHMHTVCSDGRSTYEEMVQSALALHFNFIAITDHRFGGQGPEYGICNDAMRAQVIDSCRAENRLLCIPGMEVTGRVHMVALGIQKGISTDLSLTDQVAEIHKQGGLAIAAHPESTRFPYTEDELLHSGFDAMECNLRDPAGEEQYQYWSEHYHIPCVADSDAHDKDSLGFRYNVCGVAIHSLADLKTALIEKRCHGVFAGAPNPVLSNSIR